MANAITLPALQINGINFSIVPNSLEVTQGFGTSKIKAQSAGGGSVTSVLFDDGSTKLGNVKFKIYSTDDNINNMITVKNNSNNNTVLISEDDFTKTMTNSAIINDPALMLGVDGEIDIEMEGDVVV